MTRLRGLLLGTCGLAACTAAGVIAFEALAQQGNDPRDRRVAESDGSLSESLVRALRPIVFVDVELARFEGARSSVRDGGTGVVVAPCLVLTAAHLFGPEFLGGSRETPERLRDLKVHFQVPPASAAEQPPGRAGAVPEQPDSPPSGLDGGAPAPTGHAPADRPEDVTDSPGQSPQSTISQAIDRIRHSAKAAWAKRYRTAPPLPAAIETSTKPSAPSRHTGGSEVRTVVVSAKLEPLEISTTRRDPLLDDWVLLRLDRAAPVQPIRLADPDCCSFYRLPVKAAIGGYPADRIDRGNLGKWVDPGCELRLRLANSMFATNCQATSGNSGGPVLVRDSLGWGMAGLITRAPPPAPGRRISDNVSYAVGIGREIREAISTASLRGCGST